MKTIIKTQKKMNWTYTDRFDATCSIDGKPGRVEISLQDYNSEFYDVLQIRQKLLEMMAEPTTIEKLANDITFEFGSQFIVTAEWETESHGPIKVVIA